MGVKDKVDLTKKALDVSQKAIGQAEGALRDALDNLNRTRNATATVREGEIMLFLCALSLSSFYLSLSLSMIYFHDEL